VCSLQEGAEGFQIGDLPIIGGLPPLNGARRIYDKPIAVLQHEGEGCAVKQRWLELMTTNGT
jgi:hypothetical protein